MKSVRRLATWLSCTYIAASVVFTLILNLGPIELANNSLGTPTQTWRWLGVAISIGVLLLCTVRIDDAGWSKAVKVVASILLPILFLVVTAFMSFASSMCLWSERETIYMDMKDPDHRIVVRDFGCGATDSSPPIVRVLEIKKLNAWFNYVSKIDTTSIDHKQWIPVISAQ